MELLKLDSNCKLLDSLGNRNHLSQLLIKPTHTPTMASSSSKHGATALTGHAAFARGRYSEAARAFTALMDSSGGGSAILYFNRAVAYMGMNESRAKFVCLFCAKCGALVLTHSLNTENELYRKCVKDCDQCAELEPTYLRAYILKGDIGWRQPHSWTVALTACVCVDARSRLDGHGSNSTCCASMVSWLCYCVKTWWRCARLSQA